MKAKQLSHLNPTPAWLAADDSWNPGDLCMTCRKCYRLGIFFFFLAVFTSYLTTEVLVNMVSGTS